LELILLPRLFNKYIEPSCSYCRFGTHIGNGEIACMKLGVVETNFSCKKFSYDPLKRVPERPSPPKRVAIDVSGFSVD
jgi:hypothetical protein